MPKLTKRLVDGLEPKKKPYLVFDTIIESFFIRVTSGGTRSYYVQYRKNGQRKRLHLGRHGLMTTEQAREKAIVKLGAIKAGEDLCVERATKKAVLLISDVVEKFMREYVDVHCRKRTREGYKRCLNKHILPFFKHMTISELSHNDIGTLQHFLRDAPSLANHCIAILSKLCNLAERWGMRSSGSNPCKHIKKFSIKARDRYLNTEEAQRLGEVLQQTKQYPDENLSAVHCLQLLLLTGCRLGEIQTLRWDYVDYENGLLRLPDSKTGAKVVYLSHDTIGLLQEIKQHHRRPGDNPFVICGKKPNAYLNNVQKPWRRFRKLAGLEDVRIHDLRHSFASFAVNRGMSLPMIGKLLGHTQVQTTSRYAHLMAEPMKEAANKIGSEVSQLLKLTVNRKEEQKVPKSGDKLISGTLVPAPIYLTSKQAAEYLNVKMSLLDDWRWKKKGPSFTKVGGHVRYTLQALKEFTEGLENTKEPIHKI